jgi:hypothetical protein
VLRQLLAESVGATWVDVNEDERRLKEEKKAPVVESPKALGAHPSCRKTGRWAAPSRLSNALSGHQDDFLPRLAF